MKTLARAVVFFLFASAMATAQDPVEPDLDAQSNFLKQFEGSWTEVLEFSEGPVQQKLEGTIEFKPFGELCLIYDASGRMEQMEIKRHGMISYDTSEKKFVLATVTIPSTTLAISIGQLSPNGKQLVAETTHLDPESGTPTKRKWVYELNDKNKDSFTLAYYETVGKGKETQQGKGVYFRKKK